MIAESNRLPRSTLKPASAFSGLSYGRMTSALLTLASRDVLGHGLAVDGERVAVEPAGREQFVHHRRQAAGAIIILAEIFARRLHVDQERHVVADRLPILDRKLDADVARDRDEWIGALVEPPIAEQATIAFSNAARVRMSDGFRSSRTISTARTPVS